ncbi:MAG TPA: choice-of-anchor D domain-containing protein [Myxococcota bacterium]|nr:choice-of-anchor D domain-containing protein [Myxococcota bacterium]
MRSAPAIVVSLFCLVCAGCNEDVLIETPPSMQVGVDSIEFGAIAVGRTTTRSIEIQNTGASTLRLSEPTFSGDPDSVFSVTNYDAAIEVARRGTLSVAFAPAQVMRYEAVMLIAGNDPDHPSVEVSLGGDGFRQGALEVDPDWVDFGKIDAGQVGLGQVTIRNVGNGALLVTGIELSNSTSPDFEILSSTKPGEIGPGVEIPVRLAYRPNLTSQPPGEGEMIVQAADPFNPRVEVRLTARLNRAPVADAGPDQDVDPLQEVVLDGSHSSDPDGDLPLSYAWTLVRRPEGSATVLAGETLSQAFITPDLVGIYEAQLFVTDSTGLTSLLPDRAVITAIPAERLLLELVWDSPLADLDLHLLAPGGTQGGALDCYFGNRDPDWGAPGDPGDDPKLLRDDLAGFGPETIGYDDPIGGTFQVFVDYFASHTPSGQEPTSATLRIYIDGILEAELTERLFSQGQQWSAATVKWPEGTITAQDAQE